MGSLKLLQKVVVSAHYEFFRVPQQLVSDSEVYLFKGCHIYQVIFG